MSRYFLMRNILKACFITRFKIPYVKVGAHFKTFFASPTPRLFTHAMVHYVGKSASKCRQFSTWILILVALLYFDTIQSVATFESEVRNLLSVLEPRSTDSLGHQHRAKSVSIFKNANTLALCQSKATLPLRYLFGFWSPI